MLPATSAGPVDTCQPEDRAHDPNVGWLVDIQRLVSWERHIGR